MNSRYRIAIIGLGGVGGYIGAMLAAAYDKSPAAEILFLARGENERTIRRDGIRLITPAGEIKARPSLVTSRTDELGEINLFICCIKHYDLVSSIESLKDCVRDDSQFLPLLNGIDAAQTIRNIYPAQETFEGCIYLISKLISPGVVQQTGSVVQLYFGPGQGKSNARKVAEILANGQLNVSLRVDVKEICWEKFFFISSFATITSFLDVPVGEIMRSETNKGLLLGLMQEFLQVSRLEGISFPADIVEKSMARLSALPFEASSSMHADFKKGKLTELDALTGHVVELGKKHHIPSPVYQMMYDVLHERTK
jgi:2-dehydropantoate 2-reductase